LITGHDAKLLGGITGYKLCNAAEILRHTGADWPEAEQVIEKIRPEPPHWDQIPWGTLMFADLPPGKMTKIE